MSVPRATIDLPPLHFPEELPISAHREAIAAALRTYPVTIICGDTGSGKTTQIPKIALACGRGRTGLIGCTQPRRLATLAMARRVAEELGQAPGRLVGYQHRFDRQMSDETRIKFMTDGILLAETRRDHLLRAYDTLIIDEAHERSLNIDFLLGLVKTLLPRRPDLRVLVSSATLDAGHFAEFFDDAPVLRIPGRLFPIDIRYRPPADDDIDLSRLIANAVDELSVEAEGDMLVFLPGERDIRETGEVLAGRRLEHTEIIPLLASLPVGEQQRAFRVSANRRIILATNVAETSVTLPGIRFVIDSGLARISRYSHRTQVQRLQVEPISQASANQRAGRCGRIGPGICVRLYAEDDFHKREPYTDPEILRASLAGVILSMLDLRLGDISTFPLLDPPSPAMIKEGFNELEELGAVGRVAGVVTLTALGHRLVRLPVEPRLARILCAAHDEKALRDALIVVAALECDEPRRRPLDKQAEADRLHKRFLTPHSDFAALLQLWRWYETQNPGRSQTVARRLCRDNYLSYPRMRDWRDLRDQLAILVKRLDLDGESTAGGDVGLHRALLTGLLSHIGKRDPETGDYRGARGLRFALFPGSGLVKARPLAAQKVKSTNRDFHTSESMESGSARQVSHEWIVAGELVETSRLYARQAASIDSAWIEPLAGELCKRTFHSPWWDADKGFVRVRERVTLYGILLVDGRMRDFSRINPSEARTLFIRHGLVAGEFPNPPPFLCANLERVRMIRLAEEKTRRHGQLVDEEALVAFYDRWLPEDICNADALRRWLRQAPAARVAQMELQPVDLPALDDVVDGFPDTISLDGHSLEIKYHHNPGEPDDGITCIVPVNLLPMLRAWRSDWLVPGALPEKIHWMLTALPSKLRRLLIPIEDTAVLCLQRMLHGRKPLAQALAQAIYEVRGVRVPAESWGADDYPDYLRVAFRVVAADDGRELGQGRNYEILCRQFGITSDTAAKPLAGLSHRWQQDGLVAWDCGILPEQVDLGCAGWPIINYPALVDAGTTVSLQLFAEEAAARAAHVAGVCRLVLLGLGRDGRALINPPGLSRMLQQFLASIEMDAGKLGMDLGRAVVRRACLDGQPDVRDAVAFSRCLAVGHRALFAMRVEMQQLIVSVLHEVATLDKTAASGRWPAAADDVRDTLAWLVFPGFVWTVPWIWLQHYPRYLEGIRVRLERLALNPAGDARRQAEIAPYWQRYADFVMAERKPAYNQAALLEYRWLIEEFRVSLFAQELRTAMPVSAKRLNLLWQKVTGDYVLAASAKTQTSSNVTRANPSSMVYSSTFPSG